MQKMEKTEKCKKRKKSLYKSQAFLQKGKKKRKIFAFCVVTFEPIKI